MQQQREPSLDVRIADRFKIVKKIGGGSFGRIYEGVDLMTHERVAIKIVS
jgi:casein kinase I family protein HRR25